MVVPDTVDDGFIYIVGIDQFEQVFKRGAGPFRDLCSHYRWNHIQTEIVCFVEGVSEVMVSNQGRHRQLCTCGWICHKNIRRIPTCGSGISPEVQGSILNISGRACALLNGRGFKNLSRLETKFCVRKRVLDETPREHSFFSVSWGQGNFFGQDSFSACIFSHWRRNGSKRAGAELHSRNQLLRHVCGFVVSLVLSQRHPAFCQNVLR